MSELVSSTGFLLAFTLLWVITLMLCVTTIATLRHLGLLFDALDPVLHFARSAWQLRLNESLPPIQVEDPSPGPVD
jgi:cytosine/uracil/thiamine/allantoin permease